MLARTILLAASLLLAHSATAAPAPPPEQEAALAEVASGRVEKGLVLLRRAAADDPEPALLCLLGRVETLAGEHAAAERTFGRVPSDSDCGRQAAFGRADALKALGRTDEAAGLYADHAAAALGESRDLALVTWLEALAGRALAEDRLEMARGLYELALGRRITEAERIALGRRVAEALLGWAETARQPTRLAPPLALREALVAGLLADPGPDRRRQAAPFLTPHEALAVLGEAPSDPRTARVAADLAGAVDLEWRLRLLDRLGEQEPGGALGRDARDEATLLRARLGRLGEVATPLRALAEGTDDRAREASNLHVKLLADAGDGPALIAALEAHLRRFPSDPLRTANEERLDAARMAAGRAALEAGAHDEAISAYDALVARDPRSDAAARAAYEAALAERAAGRPEAAMRRWRELMARWPGRQEAGEAVAALARVQAFDAGDPDGALKWLEQQASEAHAAAASTELHRLKEPFIALRTTPQTPGGEVRVEVLARNLERLEARLHRIDPEAYLRAGGDPEALPELDVAVIAPDRRWKVEVPGYQAHRDLAFDLPLEKPEPGLYVVTVASDELEASAVLWVSDLRLLARAVGPDLVVAAFRAGRATGGAKVLLRLPDGRIQEGRTDATGLFRTRLATLGPITLLATDRGAPALLKIGRDDQELPDQALSLSLDLDRPAYRPGDSAGFRLVARRDDAPVTGPFAVWLAEGDIRHGLVRVEAGALGTAHGALPVPAAQLGHGPWRRTLTVMVQPPGEETPRHVATVVVAPEGPPARRIEGWFDGTDAVVQVREPDGRPAAGVHVAYETDELRGGAGLTDGAGRLRVPGPPEGLAWGLTARVSGTPLATRLARSLPPAGALRLHAPDVVARGETARIQLHGTDGTYTLTWAPAARAGEAPEAPPDPWVPSFEPGLEGAAGSPRSMAIPGGVEGDPLHRSVTVAGGHVEVEVPGLTPGVWLFRATPTGGGGPHASARCRVAAPQPGLRGLRDLRAGEGVTVALAGERPALLTAGSDRLLDAAILTPGQTRSWTPTSRWAGTVEVHALSDDGRLTRRTFEVDPALDVRVETGHLPATATEPARWRLRARVVDGAGRPVRGEVALRVLDEALIREAGLPATLDADALTLRFPEAPATAAFYRFEHVVKAEPIATELLAERARAAEADKARGAAEGRWQSNALAGVLAEPPLGHAQGFGGLGISGYGSGGGGFGSGMGVGGVGRAGSATTGSPWLQGARNAAAWAVLSADADGRVELVVPVPAQAARWRLDAVAVGPGGFGAARAELDTRDRIRLSAPQPGPGSPGEEVRLLATVLNGGSATLKATLSTGAGDRPVEVRPGEALTVDLGPRAPGTTETLVLRAGEDVLDRLGWRFPLAEGRPADDGRVLHVVAAPGGGLPATWLALRPDPAAWRQAGRAAVAGRAALAALPFAAPHERPALEARVRAVRDALKTLGTGRHRSARDDAEALLFLAEAQALLGLPRGELEAAARAVRSPGADPEERIAVLYARAVAGLEVDGSALARLERSEGLTPEAASRLARLLIRLERAPDARDRVRGEGPAALLAREALAGRPDPAARRALAAQPPPLPGEYALPDWIAAAGTPPGSAEGKATVRLGEQVLGQIDRAAGGALYVSLPSGTPAGRLPVQLDGLPALVWRSNAAPDPESGSPHAPVRLPAGLDGRLIGGAPARAMARLEGERGCGEDGACVLAVGDALAPAGELDAPGFTPPAGLIPTPTQGGEVLRAVAPGRYVLAGLVDADGGPLRPLVVQVEPTAGPGGLTRAHALGRARQAVDAQEDPGPWLSPWPADTDWPGALLGERAAVRFEDALRREAPAAERVDRFEDALRREAPAAERVDRFEALREANPGAGLSSDTVAKVARAYHAAGRPGRAVDVWRAGLGGAFLAEAGVARRVEDVAGLLPSLQGVRLIAGRYPAVPAVEQALFHLPQRLDAMAEGELPEPVRRAGVTAADLRLMSAAWDREYVALWPESPRRGEAAFHLVRTLQVLEAHAEAARWADLLARRHADSPVLDGLLYLEGVSRLRLREDARALKLFERISQGDFPAEDGSAGPAASRDDARYALARLYEARGELERARSAYRAAAETHAEAGEAAEALTAVTLRPDPRVQVQGGAKLELPVVLANVETVHLRAYRLDLRTIFLRDGGLGDVLGVNVSGVSPTWSGTLKVRSDPFPREGALRLPLRERGAYLVQLEAEGIAGTALAVRTGLELDARPGPGGLRVSVRLEGRPAAGVALRSAGAGEVHAATTDVRGVAQVPGPNVLAFTDAGDFAFWPPLAEGAPDRRTPARHRSSARPKSNVDQRMNQQLQRNEALYEESIRMDYDAILDASKL